MQRKKFDHRDMGRLRRAGRRSRDIGNKWMHSVKGVEGDVRFPKSTPQNGGIRWHLWGVTVTPHTHFIEKIGKSVPHRKREK